MKKIIKLLRCINPLSIFSLSEQIVNNGESIQKELDHLKKTLYELNTIMLTCDKNIKIHKRYNRALKNKIKKILENKYHCDNCGKEIKIGGAENA